MFRYIYIYYIYIYINFHHYYRVPTRDNGPQLRLTSLLLSANMEQWTSIETYFILSSANTGQWASIETYFITLECEHGTMDLNSPTQPQ